MIVRHIMICTFFLICFSFFRTYTQKIVVTGGAGFIGSHVAVTLLQRGDSVVIIDNFNDAYPLSIKQKNIDVVKSVDYNNALVVYHADICHVPTMHHIFMTEKPDRICHLAARAGVRASIDNPYDYLTTNIAGTCVLFDMARDYGIKHLVYASSSSVYGARDGDEPFCENDLVNKQSSPYGVTKRADELLAYVYHYLFGISITSLRFFTVYGPRGRIDMAPFIFLNAIAQGDPVTVYGDGTAVRDFTYITDIVDGIIKALDTPLGYEIINLGRGDPLLVSDFIRVIESVVERKAQVHYISAVSGDVPRTYADVTKAALLLGYKPSVSVDVGMHEMYEWYKSEPNMYKLIKKSHCVEEWE